MSHEAHVRALFDAPILRGLGDRDRRAILDAARFAEIQAGEAIYVADAVADSIFVVLAGSVHLLAQRRGDRDASVIRVARAGESFGEDALLFGGTRRLSANAGEHAQIAEVPTTILERAIGRSGSDAVKSRELRFAERSAIADLLKTTAFARDLAPTDFEMLLDAARRRSVPRGERIVSSGEPADAFFSIVEGLVQLQSENANGTPEVRAYLGRGDFFGDEEIFRGEARKLTAVASGPSELVEVPAAVLRTLADRNPDLLARVRRIRTERGEAQAQALGGASSTQHVLRDAYRMQMARSLLVIDQDSCVRCGHCAWTCESLYGVSRLVRRGDKVLSATDEGARSLMLPNSCQHCRNPLCMMDCPTGAIGRDPEGEVFIREELCVGCGNCAKACPWDNIQMAPRAAGAVVAESLRSASAPASVLYPEVAQKCDLCRSYDAPACVSACPTESIFRLEPTQDIAEVAALFGGTPERATRVADRGGLVLSLTSGLALGLVLFGVVAHVRGALEPASGIGRASGWVAIVLLIALALYSVPKRLPRTWIRRRSRRDPKGAPLLGGNPPQTPRVFATPRSASLRSGLAKHTRSRMKPFYRAHLALGFFSMAAVSFHAGARIAASAAGALGFSFWLVCGLGVLGALLYRVLPTRLSRLERRGTLPEDTVHEREKLLDRLHREASGKSELVKSLLERILVPYARSASGPLALLASGRSQIEERARLQTRIDALLEGRGQGKLDGLDDLIRIVVELRSLPLRIWLTRLLRGWLVLHLVLGGIVLALLVLHLWSVLG